MTLEFRHVLVEGYDNFSRAVKEFDHQATEKGVPLIVIIKSTHEKDGKVWCRDCALLDKMLDEKMQAMGLSGIILIAQAGTLEEWMSDDNPFKTDEVLDLEGIPTAFRWKGGRPLKKLDTPDILSPIKFKALFA